MIHVEACRSQTFCGEDAQRAPVFDTEWAESPTALSRATCRDCLRAINVLGNHAMSRLMQLAKETPL